MHRMHVKLVCVVFLLLSVCLVGCTNTIEPNLEYRGILRDVDISDDHTWIKYDTEQGEVKKIWRYSYPFVDTLPRNRVYSFWSYHNRANSDTRLVRICDEDNNIIWGS